MAQIKIGEITLDLANTPAGHERLMVATGTSAKEMAASLGENSTIGTIAHVFLAFADSGPPRDELIVAMAMISGTGEIMAIIAQLRAFLADAVPSPTTAPLDAPAAAPSKDTAE